MKNEKTTDWVEYEGGTMRFRATYGLEVIGDQEPYFHVVGETERRRTPRSRWEEDSCGCLHDEALRHFPQLLTPLVKWHLSSWPSGPMHYVANSLWWWEHAACMRVVDGYLMKQRNQTSSEIGRDFFYKTCVFGAIEGEAEPNINGWTRREMQDWLEARLPKLVEVFKRDVEAAGFDLSVY